MDEGSFVSRGGTVDYGKDYEYLMNAYYGLILSLDDNVLNFKLSTNDANMDEFDDVVIEIELQDNTKHVLALQLKHVERPITFALLLLESKKTHNRFYLKKYIDSYKSIAKDNKNLDNHIFIMFTNVGIESSDDIDEDGLELKIEARVQRTKSTDAKKEILWEKSISTISAVRIQKCAPTYLTNLLRTNKSIFEIYKFMTELGPSSDNDFFKKFLLFTKQKSVPEMELLISTIILQIFPNTKFSVPSEYIDYFKYWCRLDYKNFKLDKETIRLKLAELLLSSEIPELDNDNADSFPHDITAIIESLAETFDIILVNDSKNLRRFWNVFLSKVRNMIANHEDITSWNTSVDLQTDKLTVPLSGQGPQFVRKTMKKIYLILWHQGVLPLCVFGNEHSLRAIDLCKSTSKKFILLTDEVKNTMRELSKTFLVFKNLQDLVPYNSVFERLTQKLFVNLQGRVITLEDFISLDKKLCTIITMSDILLMLEEDFKVGHASKLPEPYISRTIRKVFLSSQVLHNVKNLFVIITSKDNTFIQNMFNIYTIDFEKYLLLSEEGADVTHQVTFSQIQTMRNMPRDKFLILVKEEQAEAQFEEICHLNKGQICHLLRYIVQEVLEWCRSSSRVVNLQQYRTNRYIDNEVLFVEETEIWRYFTNNLNLICADSGMGKSVLMTILQENCHFTNWVFKINLNVHGDFFENAHTADEVIEYFIDNEKNVKRSILDVFASTNQFVFLWDGFDEAIEHRENIIKTIQDLQDLGVSQWITARRVSKYFLEASLNTFALTLEKFSEKDQFDYISKYLANSYNNEDLELMTDTLNKAITTSLQGGHFDHSGVPLHLHMAIQVFLKHPGEPLKDMITLTDLYQRFIQGKFDDFYKKASGADNFLMQQIEEIHQRDMLPLYEAAALKTYFDDEKLLELNLNADEGIIFDSNGTDPIGLILTVKADGMFIFVHKTFEEFLAAGWLSKNFKNHIDLVELLFNEKFSNIRFMFDMLVAKGRFAHLAVLYRNLELLKINADEIMMKDDAGRNVLHIAASWGRRHPLITQLDEMNDDFTSIKDREFTDIIQFLMEKDFINLEFRDMVLAQLVAEPEKIIRYLTSLEKQEYLGEKILIYGPSIPEVEKENEEYIEILHFLLSQCHRINETDDLLQWDSLRYADITQSLAAINLLIIHHLDCLELLKNFNHLVTLLHYSVVSSYHNILEKISSLPVIEYVYDNGGRVSLLQAAVDSNNLPAVSLMLKTDYNCLVNTQSAFLETPLNAAIFHQNMDMISVLLDAGAVCNVEPIPGLLAAIYGRNEDICRVLLERGANPNDETIDNKPLLFHAAQLNELKIMILLLKFGANVNSTFNGLTVTNFAIAQSNVGMVSVLLKFYPEINQPHTEMYYTSLHYACRQDNVDIVKLLLTHNANTKARASFQLTPLHLAIGNRYEGHIIELVRKDKSVLDDFIMNDDKKLTPLVMVVIENLPKCVRLFLENGAESREALNDAIESGFTECVDIFTEFEIKSSTYSSTEHLHFTHGSQLKQFVRFCKDGDLESIKGYPPEEVVINSKDPLGYTPLYYCILNKHFHIVEYLFDTGISMDFDTEILCLISKMNYTQYLVNALLDTSFIDTTDSNGNTPLFNASSKCNSCVQILLEKGASPNITGSISGHTNIAPIFYAILSGKTDFVKMFLKHGADLALGIGSLSSLHLSAICRDLPAIKLLLCEEINVNVKEANGYTPLHYLCDKRASFEAFREFIHLIDYDYYINASYIECVKKLLEKGANIIEKNNAGDTPLHLACRNKDIALVQLLKDSKADTSVLNLLRQTPFHISCLTGSLEIILLLHSTDPKLVDSSDKTPLNYLSERLHLEIENLNVFKQFVQLGADVNYPDNDGVYLLQKAILANNLDFFLFLVESGANTKLPGLLCLAIQNKCIEFLSFLLAKGVDVNEVFENGNSPLCLAVKTRNVKVVEAIYGNGADINIKNAAGNTPLLAAIQFGNAETVEFLLKNGADVYYGFNDEDCPLLSLAIIHKPTLVALLISYEGRINQKALFAAVEANNFDLVLLLHQKNPKLNFTQNDLIGAMLTNQPQNGKLFTYLIDNGSYVTDTINKANNKGVLPLHSAILSNYLDLVKVLIQYCNIDQAALVVAAKANNLAIVQLLRDKNPNLHFDREYLAKLIVGNNPKNVNLLNYLEETCINPNAPEKFALHEACRTGNKQTVIELVNKGVNVSRRDNCQLTPLMLASTVEIAEILLGKGAKINDKEIRGWTPVFFACFKGKLSLVQFLHKNGADLNAKDRKGGTALMEAAKFHQPVVKYLLENGCDPEDHLENGATALVQACNYNNFDCFRCLIGHAASANVRLKNEFLYTPLHIACYNGCVEIVESILAIEDDDSVICANSDGFLALTCAVAAGQLDAVKVFANTPPKKDHSGLRKDEWNHAFKAAVQFEAINILEFILSKNLVDINQKYQNDTFLHMASENKHYKSAQFLIKNEANLEAKNYKDETPIYRAAILGHFDIVKLLVEAGVDVNVENHHGTTPLYAAASAGHLEILQYLHVNKAKINVIDHDGDSPLHDAAAQGYLNIVTYLIKNGADFTVKNKNGRTPLDMAINQHDIQNFLKDAYLEKSFLHL